MSNFKLVKTAAAFALGASVITSAMVVPADASAASKYKLKSGKLIVSKTGKVAKGTITYKKIVYKNGKKLTGLKGKVYYKAGKKATGTYKGTYYVKGAAKVKTGTYNKAYYVKGKRVVTTGLYKAQYYKAGKKATGTYKSTYYVNGVKKATTGYYNNAYYVKGKRVVTTGLYKNTYYVKGKVSTGLALYKKVLYNKGKANTGLAVFNNNLYDGSTLNKGEKLFEEKLYIDGNLNKGLNVFDGKLYEDASINKGVKLFEEKLYDGAELNKGVKLFEEKLYDGGELSKGVTEFEKKFYNDGVIADGTFVVNGKDEAFEAGVKVSAKVAKAEIGENKIVITFNKAINQKVAEAVTSATDKSSTLVSVTDAVLSNPELSENGRTLTVDYTFKGSVSEFKNAVLTVQAVATKSDAKEITAKFAQVVNYKDTVAPTVKAVKSETNSTIATTATVQLSEQVKAGVQVRVNGINATVKPFIGTTDELELTGLSLETGKTHKVEVLNLEDKVGNKTLTTSAEFTVSVDSAIPTVTAKSGGSDKEIILTFTKSMKADSISGIVVRDESLSLVNMVSNTFTAIPGTNNTQYKASVNVADLFKNTNTRNFTVVVPRNLEDRLGNRTNETLTTVSLAKDSSAPTLVSSNVVKNLTGQVTSIEFNFSEELAAKNLAVTGDQSLQKLASSVVTSNGILDVTTFNDFVAVPIKAGDKKVVFEWKPASNVIPPTINGQFTFTFAKGFVSDASATGNQSDSIKHTVNFNTQAAATEFTLQEGTRFDSADNEIRVKFNESVRGGNVANSATDANNYTLSGKALPSDTFIYLDSTKAQKEVVIRLPKGTIAKSDKFAVLSVANILNVGGNKTVKTESRYTTVVDNVDPKLNSARVLSDGKTIELVYNEAMKAEVGADVKSAYTITVNNVVVALNSLKVTSVNGSTILATLATDVGTETPAIIAPDTGFYSLDKDNKPVPYKAVKEDKLINKVADKEVTYTFFSKGDTIIKEAMGIAEVKAAEDGFYAENGKAYTPVAKDKITHGEVTSTYYAKGGVIKAAIPGTNSDGGLDVTKVITVKTIADKLVTDLESNNQLANETVTALR